MKVHSSFYIHIFSNKENIIKHRQQQKHIRCLHLSQNRDVSLFSKSPQPCSESIQFLSNSLWEFKGSTINFMNDIIFLSTVGCPVSCTQPSYRCKIDIYYNMKVVPHLNFITILRREIIFIIYLIDEATESSNLFEKMQIVEEIQHKSSWL